MMGATTSTQIGLWITCVGGGGCKQMFTTMAMD
jgi:hypothetical protein